MRNLCRRLPFDRQGERQWQDKSANFGQAAVRRTPLKVPENITATRGWKAKRANRATVFRAATAGQ
jgi:hypothetical protein